MKYAMILLALASISYTAEAQSRLNPQNEYQQKKYLDSLRKKFRQRVILPVPQPQLIYDTPVMPLLNDGKKQE